MEIQKANNQYYAEYIESRVVAFINKELYVLPDCIANFPFSESELSEMDNDAFLIANTIGGISATWVGRHCGNEKCDLIVDGAREIELKYVSGGTGTYLNASLSYFSERCHFTPFTDYTHKFICPILEPVYGASVYDNLSPVTLAESKNIRHNHPELYEQIVVADKKMRILYVSNLFDYFQANPTILTTFISDCITKNIGSKSAPSELIIFNHQTKQVTTYNCDTILAKIKNKSIKKTPLGLVFDNFRVAIGWQNGNGLNNPTFRVFLK